jgi:3-oxoacyl-[acyl-carrier-protein] synthase II
MIDKKSERRYDNCIKYTMVSAKHALKDAGLSKTQDTDAFEALDKTRVGVLIGSGMGGLQVFQDGVENLVTKARLPCCSLKTSV